MIVYRDLKELKAPPPRSTALTLGCFDGLHIGHQEIMERVLERRGADCATAGLITFEPCPILMFGGNGGHRCLITTTDEKLEILEESGLDWALVIPFTREFTRMSAEDFVSDVLVNRLGAGCIVAGHDVGFGHKRRGNARLLRAEGRRHGIKVQVLEPVRVSGEVVSSTVVRGLVAKPDLATAADMLGRPFFLRGVVSPGNRLGRTIGTPTANMEMPPHKLLPPEGVYAARARIGQDTHQAVLSIGKRPTVDDSGALAVEAHILDFQNDIYDRVLHVEPLEFLRPQQKFASLDELKANIRNDIGNARRILQGTSF